MEKSPTISELAKALCKFQSKMGAVVFDANNPFFKSKYATLSAIVAKAKPILSDCGLSISQPTEGEGGVTTILMHESGEFISSTLTLKSVKDDPQGHGSAITYARRYSFSSILGIVSDQDDDGNESSYTSGKETQENAPEVLQNANKQPSSETLDPSKQKINAEQGQALLVLLKNNNYSKADLEEFILFEFDLTKLSGITNGHLIKIKENFAKPKVKVSA